MSTITQSNNKNRLAPDSETVFPISKIDAQMLIGTGTDSFAFRHFYIWHTFHTNLLNIIMWSITPAHWDLLSKHCKLYTEHVDAWWLLPLKPCRLGLMKMHVRSPCNCSLCVAPMEVNHTNPPSRRSVFKFCLVFFVRQLISPLGSFSSHHLCRLSFWGYSKNCSLSSDLSLFSPYLSYHWSLQSPQCTLLTPSTPSATHQSWVNSSNCSPWQRGPQSVTPTAWGITGLLLTLSHLRTSQTKHTIIQQLHTHTHICFVLFCS